MINKGHGKKKRMFKRIIALLIVVAMVSGLLPMPIITDDGEDKGLFGFNTLTAKADASNGDLTSYADVSAYAALYSGDPGAHQNDTIIIDFNQQDTILSAYTGIGTSEYPFSGTIKIANVSGDDGGLSTNMLLQAPLFDYIADTAQIVDANNNPCTLYLTPAALGAGESFTTPLFANHVVGHGNTTSKAVNWSIRIGGSNARSSVIGDLVAGTVNNSPCAPYVNLTYYNVNASVSGTSNLGLVCNSINSGELKLTLSNGAECSSISTTSGNAGGLVGNMESSTTLTINSDIAYASTRTITTSDGYAGGLVGSCKGTVAIGNHTYTDAQETTLITGSTGAGGLFGYLELASDYTINLDNFSITTAQNGSAPGVGIQATGESGCVGGIIGRLVNAGTSSSSAVITISGTSMSATDPVVKTTLAARSSYSNGGGLIGVYHANALESTLNIENLYIQSYGEYVKQYYGGLIAVVESESNCGAYVKIKDVKVYTDYNPITIEQYQDNKTSSGLICYSSYSFIDVLGAINPTGQVHVGLFYAVPSGVIRLSGQTNLSNLTTIGSNVLIAANRGNTLIYAQGTGTDYDSVNQTGWSYIRPSIGTMDDINPWGQTVRLVDGKAIDDSNSTVATWSSSAHTLTLASAVTSMSTPSDFARTALNIQLNTSGADFGALKFTDQNNSTSSSLLAANLTVTADISLVGTGLTGYTRDNAAQNANTNLNPSIPAISGSGNFTGSFKPSGSDVTIYLATGEAYGYKGSGNAASTATGVYSGNLVSANNMTGAIVSHRYNGLFAQLGSCTIGDATNTLTISGSITVCTDNNNHHHDIGGLASDISGSPVTIQKVITNETINVSASGNEYDGFLVGNIPNGSAETLTINNCSSTGTANVMCNGAAVGFIGRSVDNNLSTTVNTMTIGSTINYKGSGRPYAGGLFGRIGEKVDETVVYTRDLTLKNVTVENETVNSDITNSSASVYDNPAGGLLGGQWLNTNVYFGTSSINGVTVTSGTLSLTDYADCAGGLVADATGYWQVNKVDITSMTVSGADTALGLLVYKGNTAVNKGLYIEITSPTAYIITPTSVTSDSPAVYDEIVAYSMYVDGDGVVSEANGQGIVSIKTTEVSGTPKLSMNSSNDNCYQPTTTLGSNHNPNTRYYYNLDYLLTNASTAGEKFLLWSVNQYAASNIKGNTAIGTARTHGFSYYDTLNGAPDKNGNATKAVIIDGTSATMVDLTNLSYYPVDITLKNGLELSNVTIKLYNSEMQTAHGSNYDLNGTRTGQTNNSQHYLMHAALFKDVATNLTINNMTLQGSVSSHGGTISLSSGSGAIVCGTITGTSADSKQTTTIDGLVLDGIKVNGLGNTNDTDALIVRGIGDYVNFNISNVSTTSNYTNGAPAAHYLMGEAAGAGMIINFSSMVLDGRTTASSLYNASATTGDAGALNTAYNTKQSIFDQAIFLKSLNYTTSGGSSAKYDYSWTEDWEDTIHQVTYGKEIVDSVEFANKEYQYAPRYNNYYTSPESNSAGSKYADFSNYRPYVYTYNSSTNYHEIAVNIVDVNLTKGCGTYNDPYVVDASQLEVVANVLNSNVSTDFYLFIDKQYTGGNYNDESVKWCDGKSHDGHYKYVYNGSKFDLYEFNSSINDWKLKTKDKYTIAQVQHYLASAYYEIDGDITLGSTFAGLGGNSSAAAFRGVIIGKADTETGAYPVITNESANPLVKISNGAVVKNIDISVTASNIALSTDKVGNGNSNGGFGYGLENTPYYGAVIGEIMGGDNVIDRVKVTFGGSTTITVGGDGEVNIPVGAYIGVDVNGSVIFRNMTETVAGETICFANASSTGFAVYKLSDIRKSNNLASTTITYTSETEESFTNLYVNPIIGRVINGVAIYETDAYRYSEDGYYVDSTALSRTGTRATETSQTTMKNGRKNFSIPDFNKDQDAAANTTATESNATILFFSGDNYTNISVPNAQSLYVMSAICQMNAGRANNQTAYDNNTKGRDVYDAGYAYKGNNNTVHLAQYSSVGTDSSTKPDDFNIAKMDESNLTYQVPYLIYKYTNSYTVTMTYNSNNYVITKYPARRITRDNVYDITLTGNNSTYYLPDSFRGIGSVGSTNGRMNVRTFDGNNNTIDVNTYFRSYASSTDNYYNTNESGVGLFNYVTPSGTTATNGVPNTSYGFKNFTLQGYMSAKRATTLNTIQCGDELSNNKYWRVGGIVPYENNANTYDFENISLNSLVLDGNSDCGGFVGKINVNTGNFYINNCSADKLKVGGYGNLGGMIGSPRASNVYVNTKSGATGSFKVNVHQLNHTLTKYAHTGGLFGYVENNNKTNVFLVKNVNVIGWNGSFSTSSTEEPFIGRKSTENLTTNVGTTDPNGNGLCAGGIVGKIDGGKTVIENAQVYGVSIYGWSSGGICGSAQGENIQTCFINCGLHGKSTNSITIDETITYTVQGHFEAGGIAGYSHDQCRSGTEDSDLITFDVCGTIYTRGMLTNLNVHDYTIKQTQSNTLCSVGGILGVSRNKKMICNAKVENCVFSSNGATTTKMGGIIGLSSKYNLYGYNIAVINNSFEPQLTNSHNYAWYGLTVGGNQYTKDTAKNTPNQIMLSGFTSSGNMITAPFEYIKDKKTTTIISSGERNVEFVYGRHPETTDANGLYLNNFGTAFAYAYIDANSSSTYNPGSYIIYSDYNTLCDGNSKGTTASTVNNTGNVSDANGLLPYAITSPYVELGDKRLTGDGIWVETDQDSVNVIADQIVSDWTTATTGTETYDAAVYKNFSATDVAIYNQLKADGKISTYNTQVGSNVLPNDIPVIVMDDSSYEITIGNNTYDYDDAIKAYIRILTNSAYRFDGQTTNREEQIYSIDLLKCTYSNGTLTASASDVTVARSNAGDFSMNTSVGYDSSTNGQFTLLDVKFYNPGSYSTSRNNRTSYAYHLYIPLYTKKMLPFKFDITALSGTSYYPSSYLTGTHFADIENRRGNDSINTVVEDYGTPVTMYMRYEYDLDDIIEDVLGGGYGLNWNYDKSLDFIYNYSDDGALPTGTRFVLVDVNKKDKVNYSTGFTASSGADLDINGTVFPAYSFTDGSGDVYSVVTFAELLNKRGISFTATSLAAADVESTTVPIFHAVPTNASDSSQFSADGLLEGYSLVPASDSDKTTGTDLYTVTATGGNTLYEDYYLTIYAPSDTGDVRHQITVRSNTNLTEAGKVMASCSANDAQILMFANLFTKTISIKTIEDITTDKLMGEGGGDTMTVQAVSTIGFNSTGLGDQMSEVILQLNQKNIPIYHSTQLFMAKTESDNTTQTVAVNGTTYTLVPAATGFNDNMPYNSGVYVTMDDSYNGQSDCYYEYSDEEKTAYYKQMISTSSGDDISGSRITNFYEVKNLNNGSAIDLRPYLTGSDPNLTAGAHEVKVVANFTIGYTSAGIEGQFPIKEGDSTAGTTVSGQASLAYTPDGTTYSNTTSLLTLDTQARKYYRNPTSKTKLSYNVILGDLLTSTNAQVKTNDMLGVNPKDEGTTTSVTINTYGDYNTTQLIGAGNRSNIKWTLSLYRREPIGDDGEYGTALPIQNYLTNIKVYGVDSNGDKDTNNVIPLTSGDGTTELVYIAARENFEDVTIRVNPEDTTELTNKFLVYVDYDVKTGSGIETPGYFYSNYKVILTGELVGDTSSIASDHVIYTNARLDPTFIDSP